MRPDVVAPGHRLVAVAASNSSLYRDYPELRVLGTAAYDYLTLSGTSMAAAVATGSIARVDWL